MKGNEELADMLIKGLTNLNRLILKDKPHIKKYNKIRNLHNRVLESMDNYIDSGKYDIKKSFKKALEGEKELQNMNINLDKRNKQDDSIITELFVYKTTKKIPSLTEIYLENKKFKNEEKVKMLESMNNSYVSLFKIIDNDRTNAIITYQDVYTNKRYKVIDIGMSATLIINPKNPKYIYNRIIKYDDIYFGTGIHCITNYDNKYLRQFLKNKNKQNYNNFVRCLILYNIMK